ncbi:catalase family protein [Sphingomonas sp. RB3P16]|uniref:catalase family protein n=1 Tax=Parasphingomonas frigoris TaxID=3096163 RepID=UPI002FC9D57A
MSDPIKPPVRFSPAVEKKTEDETETSQGLNAALHDILETTSQDYGHAVRSVHAKSHGILEGELTVHDGLPAELAQGAFATPGTHPAVMRFSTNPGDILDDAISVPRGLAIKLLDVAGERLPGSEGETTQDFVMINGPAFATPNAKPFLANLKLLAKTTDKAEGAKKVLSAVLRGTEAALEAIGLPSPALQTLGGAPNIHPLGETYYSATPFRFGDYIAKFSLAPVSPNLTAVTKQKVDTKDRPDALREEIAAVMTTGDAEWELRVQLCRDLETMPIEKADAVWDEAASPYVTVATLRVPSQSSWTWDRAKAIDDGMRFSVWTGLAAHQPLGQINRVRQSAYQMSSDFRAKFNGCPIHEPKALASLD